MALMSTLGIGDGCSAGGEWGSKTVVAGAENFGLEETAGEVWSQDCSGE